MKQSITFLLACGLLIALSRGELQAQKGHGKMGGPGLGLPVSTGTAKSGESPREAAKLPSNNSSHAIGSPKMNASERLATNASLSANIQPLLPAGSTLAAASAGFRNQGQFIAALHVSRNLNIPFDQLKAKLTGNNPETLGKAVHDLRPSLSKSETKANVRAAERQADQDMDSARTADLLSTNAVLSARVQALLPAGTNLQTTATGFENVQQLLLAEHISHDLNIPFAQLKTQLTGTGHVSFQQAVAALMPNLSSATIKSDVQVARQETQADLQAAGLSAEQLKEGGER